MAIWWHRPADLMRRRLVEACTVHPFVLTVVAGLSILAVVSGAWFGLHPQSNSTAWPPERATTLADLKARPEGHLFYPGATLVSPLGTDEDTSLFGGSAAFAGGILRSNEPPETIYAWYHSWLVAHGWVLQRSGPDYSGAWVSSAKSYRGARESFIVAMDDAKYLGVTTPGPRTVFEVRYSVIPYSQSK